MTGASHTHKIRTALPPPRVAGQRLIAQAIARTIREVEDPAQFWAYNRGLGINLADVSRQARARLTVLRSFLR